MTSEADRDSAALRVLAAILIAMGLLALASAYLGYYTIARNAYDNCESAPRPHAVDGSRESAVADAHAVLVPVALSCSFYTTDGSTIDVLRPDWVSTGALVLGAAALLGGTAML
ncbi:MAG: hypothetical protein ACTHKX_01390, partial [Pseudolysinimonas sp.]